MKNEENTEIIRQAEDYWSKINEEAITSEMGRIIHEYKAQNRIETLVEEEFTDLFGIDTLYPVYYKPMTKWLDSYCWTVYEWQEYHSDYVIDLVTKADEIDLGETEQLSENDQVNDLRDEYYDSIIEIYCGLRINESGFCVGNTLNDFYKQRDAYTYNKMMKETTELDYIDYNETMTEITNDFWSGADDYFQYTEWLEQIARERSESLANINAEGHGPNLSSSEIDAIIGLSGQKYLSAPIDIKLGDAILLMLRIVHLFKFKMMDKIDWDRKNQEIIGQAGAHSKKEQVNTWFWNDLKWIKEVGQIYQFNGVMDLMLEALLTMNGSHYRTRDRDYDWEDELGKIFVEMPFGHEFDRAIINFLLLPLYHSTHRMESV